MAAGFRVFAKRMPTPPTISAVPEMILSSEGAGSQGGIMEMYSSGARKWFAPARMKVMARMLRERVRILKRVPWVLFF